MNDGRTRSSMSSASVEGLVHGNPQPGAAGDLNMGSTAGNGSNNRPLNINCDAWEIEIFLFLSMEKQGA